MQPGDTVADRFVVERLAGYGAMGVVYRARDLRTSQPVALKVLRGAQLHDAELRFEREALTIAELDDEGIVRHVAHGLTADGRPYLAMEWIDGEDLADRLQRGPLSVDETITVGLRVATALGAAHRRGIVHRDLKPGNVVLAGDALERAKIVDFGLATFPAAIRATSSGAVLGTPAYMAPEQARGVREIDARADVFALGCVLHECLTGRPAYDGHHVMAVLVKIVFEDVPRLRDLGRRVPPALDDLIARMLAKDPAARPADGDEVALLLGVLEASMEPPSEIPVISSVGPRRLTPAEERLLCIVLARPPPSGVSPVAETLVDQDSQDERLDSDALAAIASRGGVIVMLADGSLAVTGLGTGLATDQAALAAGSALALREGLPGWAIAVATGRAHVDAPRPFGDAIERATRRIRERQRRDGPAAIDLDDVTAGLLDLRFDVVLGPLGLELRGELEVAEGARTLRGRPTAFVGRERELATLTAIFTECVDEPVARAVLVTAPAGVGKSRLRHELVERMRARGGVEIWVARADPMRDGAPFGLLIPLLRRAARLYDGEPVEARRQKLLARVSRHVAGPDQQRVAEFLGELTGTPFPDEGRVQLRAARQDPRLLGDQMRRAWVDLLNAETRAQPLVLILEDLHWGDAPSVEYIGAALRLLGDRPLFCLALARPDVHARLPRLWHGRAAQEIGLSELSRRACEQLTRDVLGAEVSQATVTRLWERSGGNAFFLEELLRATAEGRGDTLPETMLAMVESRLEALDPEDRRLLRAASVFGDVFWSGGLAALLGRGDTLHTRLARLEEDEWLVRRPDAKFDGEVEHVFRHALVREGAYGTLTDDDRALGHRLAASWLAAAGETDALVLAEHRERGGQPDKAAGWYGIAAEQALEANDLGSVVTLAERAVTCGASGEALGRAALARAIAHNWRGERAFANTWAQRAADALPEGSARWCAAMGEMVWTVGSRGSGAELDRLSDELVASMIRVEAPGAHVIALSHAVGWLLMDGQHQKARAIQEAMRPLLSRLRSEPAVEAAWYVIGARFAADEDPLASRGLFEAAVACFEAAGDRRQVCFHRTNLADTCLRLGAPGEAEELAHMALVEARELGLTQVIGAALQCLGFALLQLGEVTAAAAVLREGIAACTVIDDILMEGVSHAYLAEALRRSGDLPGAETEARRAISVLVGFLALLPLASATLTEILLMERRPVEALQNAQSCYRLLEELGQAVEGEARVRLVYVDALRANGRHAEALAVLADARERLLARAARITDVTWRRSFLENVPENARTLSLARLWLDAPA